eukprot:scaffold204_cov113-Isochrysis_galbana.AAC.8
MQKTGAKCKPLAAPHTGMLRKSESDTPAVALIGATNPGCLAGAPLHTLAHIPEVWGAEREFSRCQAPHCPQAILSGKAHARVHQTGAHVDCEGAVELWSTTGRSYYSAALRFTTAVDRATIVA